MTSARKSGFRPPPLSTCVQMSLQTSPLVDVRIPSEKMTLFLGNFSDFGYPAGKFSIIISSAKISDDLLLVFSLKKLYFHTLNVTFLILCVDVHMRLTSPPPSTCV